MMREQFLQLTGRIDSMQLRERVLLLLTVTALVYFLVDTLLLQPVLRQQELGQQDIANWEMQLDVLRERSGLLSGEPGDATQQQRDRLLAQLAELDGRLYDRLGALLEPDQAIEVLGQVLAQQQGLQLHKADAVSEPLSGLELEGAGDVPAGGIGRYELRLELQGSFLGTLRYLQALEALPWKFFWEAVDFEVIEYPIARVTVDIYTLGLFEG